MGIGAPDLCWDAALSTPWLSFSLQLPACLCTAPGESKHPPDQMSQELSRTSLGSRSPWDLVPHGPLATNCKWVHAGCSHQGN